MATVNGMATSYDLPQYIGELFQKGEKPNALLRLIGGLTGAIRLVTTPEFAMGVDYELPAASSAGIKEGQDPTLVEQKTNQSTNLVQIFQEGVSLTYTAQGAVGQLAGLAAIPGQAANGNAVNDVRSIEWQRLRALERVARNANLAFLRGTYQKPVDNTTARQTRGIRNAVTTNLFANGGTARAISKSIIEDALKEMVDNGAFTIGDELFVLADALQYGATIALYENDVQKPTPGQVAGVMVNTIDTKWARLHMVYEPDMQAGELLITQPKFCRVVGMEIPNKGVLFSEPLAKTGSADKEQVYGELGIDYRNEIFHGLIDDLS